MMKKLTTLTIMLAFLMLGSTSFVAAQDHGDHDAMSSEGYRTEYLNMLKIAEEKLTGLAEAIPADKYSWRPAEGVRSVGEVYMHVAAANFGLMQFIGISAPEGFDFSTFEGSQTEKAAIISQLKESFAFVRDAISKMEKGQANKAVTIFGNETTYRGALLFFTDHTAEHLGQSIAYARMNGVVPPWSQGQ